MDKLVSWNRLFVGNLSKEVSSALLKSTFSRFGSITQVEMVIDRHTGEFRGHAFIEFASPRSASDAKRLLNGQFFLGKVLKIDFAEETSH